MRARRRSRDARRSRRGPRPGAHALAREAGRAADDPRRGGDLRAGSRWQRAAAARGAGRAAARSPILRASPSSPSSRRRRSRDSPRTTRSAQRAAATARAQAVLADFDRLAEHLERVYAKATGRRRPPAPWPSRRGRPARRPRLDRRRPPHAHEPVARLLDRAAGADRPRRGGGARSDRRHRPQRLRRRARDRRARAQPRADRDSRARRSRPTTRAR